MHIQHYQPQQILREIQCYLFIQIAFSVGICQIPNLKTKTNKKKFAVIDQIVFYDIGIYMGL